MGWMERSYLGLYPSVLSDDVVLVLAAAEEGAIDTSKARQIAHLHMTDR